MGVDNIHGFAVLDLMMALEECDLLPMRGSAKTDLSRLKQAALTPRTGSEFVAVYRSTALISQKNELKNLVDHSRTNNTRLNISGILLHYDINFLQVLEGEESVVRNLLATIGKDRRHTSMEVLFTQKAYQRVFADWSMDLIDVSPEDVEAIFSRLSDDGSRVKSLFSALYPTFPK